MSSRESFDQERVVRRTEVHNVAPAAAEPPVVREVVDPATGQVVRQEVVPAAPVEHAAAVSEVTSVDHVVARRAMIDQITRGIWFLAGLLEAALAFRIAFLLFEANPDSGFVRFINAVTDPFVAPFNGIFTTPESEGAVFDSNALLAMFVYLLAAWALVRLVWLLFDRPETGKQRAVRQEQSDIV
ncbi:MAG: hypothetical protein DCC58_18580 [Chloroflexi bacterium]|nr:MAG: hypothetical protein DCC58_18580 [Chloroflexota bacterium]